MGYRLSRKLTIEWGHCDPAGIVFNPRFFEYFDWSTARLVHIALDLGAGSLNAAYGVVGIPLVDTRANFMRPSRYGDEVEIASEVTHVGRSSFEIDHRLFNRGELAVEAHEKRVWTVRDKTDGRLRSQAIPEDAVRKLTAV